MERKTTLFYDCPKCKSEQEVYFDLNGIIDGGHYSFDTECSKCKLPLFIKVTFKVEIFAKKY
ncbi:MAG: hypothetical protein QXY62_03125 [Candidatus Altiarchaeota archaeon]